MYADPDGHMPKWAKWVIGGVVCIVVDVLISDWLDELINRIAK